MDRGRAETHLRQLAEAELRRAAAPGVRGRGYPGRLSLVAQALVAVGAVDVGTADEIQADLDLALAARLASAGAAPQQLAGLIGVRPPRAVTTTFTAPRQPSWRVVPAGQVIRIRDDQIRGELGLLAYLQTGHGGRFTMAGRMHGPAPDPGTPPPRPGLPVSRQFTAADDKGASYTLRFSFRTGLTGSAAWAGVLDLRPDPPHEIGWLDLRSAPGEPATRIRLDPPDPQIPAPEVTVTRTAHSPGELLLDVIAARILTSAGSVPPDNPGQLAGATAELRAFVGDGPGYVVAALQAAGALPVSSPAPGQLAGLCARLGITGHGITTPPAAGLPDRWLNMLTSDHRREPQPAPAPGSWTATAAELPQLDGARLAVLGLHQAERGTILYLHAGGVTMEDDWEYYRAVRPLPALWIRDHAGRWHATRDYAPRPLGDSGEVTLELAITPPLEAGTPWIDLVAAGQSAEVWARLPLTWKRNPLQRPERYFTLAGLLDILGHAGRPVIHQPAHAPARRSCRGSSTTPRRTRRSSGHVSR
jgi:hypothetical protein